MIGGRMERLLLLRWRRRRRWSWGLLALASLIWLVRCAAAIGANWGTQASHLLPPSTVVQMLRDNGIDKVKLFDADGGPMRALAKTGIQIMVGIPNDMLAGLAADEKAAERWVSKNVSKYIDDGVDVRYFTSSVQLRIKNSSFLHPSTMIPTGLIELHD